MAIPTDPERKDELAKVVGRRLKECRRSAGISQAQAALALKHKGITQVSLAEGGERLPPLLDLMKYAELYSVPMDFLVGRINDPISEACEMNQTMIIRSIANSIGGMFNKFANATGEHVSVSLSNLRRDRADLVEMIELAEEADVALARLRELNPEFEELRGGSKVEGTLLRIAAMGRRMDVRTRDERRQFDMIDRVLDLEKIVEPLEHFQLQFQFVPVAGAPTGVAEPIEELMAPPMDAGHLQVGVLL